MRIYYTNQFKGDYKRVKKQHKDHNKLRTVIEKLVAGEPLEDKYKDPRSRGIGKDSETVILDLIGSSSTNPTKIPSSWKEQVLILNSSRNNYRVAIFLNKAS